MRVDDRGDGNDTEHPHCFTSTGQASSAHRTETEDEREIDKKENKKRRVENTTDWLAQFSEETASLYRALDILTDEDPWFKSGHAASSKSRGLARTKANGLTAAIFSSNYKIQAQAWEACALPLHYGRSCKSAKSTLQQ